MYFSEEIKKIRMKAFLSQTAFAKEVGVSFSTVNRWENGKGKPNLTAMRRLKEFCIDHSIPFDGLENEWVNHLTVTK